MVIVLVTKLRQGQHGDQPSGNIDFGYRHHEAYISHNVKGALVGGAALWKLALEGKRAELDNLCKLPSICGQPPLTRLGKQDHRLSKMHRGGFQ